MRGMIEGFGGIVRFSILFLDFWWWKTWPSIFCVAVVSLKKGFFLFVFVCFSFWRKGGGGEGVGKYYLALIEALAGDFFFASIPSPIPVTSNPNGGTPPDSISKKSSKKVCFCSYVKERNTFFYGRYVIEGDILERIKVCCLWEQRIPVQNIVGYRHPGISWWKI